MMRFAVPALVMLAVALPAAAQRLSFDNPDHQVAMYRKIQCSTRDLEPVVYHWSGRVWSRVPGEPDRHLWNVEGMNIRQCVTVEDKARGKGVRMVSRELMLYLDPATGNVLDTWTNPWTDKVNRIFHVANDPVNQRPVFPRGPDGAPFAIPMRVEDGRIFWNIEVPLFYTNPMGGDFQDFVGNHYHAMEIFNFIADEAALRDPRTRNAKAAVSWVRLSGWMPFMEMGSRPGALVFNATGQVVEGVEALPLVLKDQIARRYPEYRVPPPADDARPNATTWTEFRKFIEAERARANPR
ncbi:DUF1838 family protein [Thermaurantiacus sp.]